MNPIDEKILVTGASGFIGRHLVFQLAKAGYDVEVACRSTRSFFGVPQRQIPVHDGALCFEGLLDKAGTVFHLAGATEAQKFLWKKENKFYGGHSSEYFRGNVLSAKNLALAARRSKVRRIIFVSSIGAVASQSENVIGTDTVPCPTSDYGKSKLFAEKALRKNLSSSGVELVIVRPPLVYGPGVKGNFRSILGWIDRGLPLPFGGIGGNCRPFLGVSNLVDFLCLCIHHPEAPNNPHHPTDGEGVSTAELILRIGKALARPQRNFYFPPLLLRSVFCLLGKKEISDKIFGNLRVNWKDCLTLGWRPVNSMQAELNRTAEWWRMHKKCKENG